MTMASTKKADSPASRPMQIMYPLNACQASRSLPVAAQMLIGTIDRKKANPARK